MNEPTHRPKLPSLADYLIRYDLTSMMEEARLDYSQSSAGTPRHLDQKEIAARFRKPHPVKRAPNE
jgi:hypothetical protein